MTQATNAFVDQTDVLQIMLKIFPEAVNNRLDTCFDTRTVKQGFAIAKLVSLAPDSLIILAAAEAFELEFLAARV